MHRRKVVYRVVVGVCLTVVVLLVAACGSFAPFWETVECTPDWFGMTITPPPSADILEERCRSAFNPDYTLVFTMSPSDLGAFQAATPVTNWSTDASMLLDFQDEAARATTLLAGTFGNGAIAVDALIDMSDPNLYTVYYEAVFVD